MEKASSDNAMMIRRLSWCCEVKGRVSFEFREVFLTCYAKCGVEDEMQRHEQTCLPEPPVALVVIPRPVMNDGKLLLNTMTACSIL